MNIQLHHQNLDLTDDQKAYVIEKIHNVSKYERRITDEATVVRVDIEKNKVKDVNEQISLHITFFVPHAVIRAEVLGITLEEAADKAIEKLRKQIERYKTKKHRRNKDGEWIPESTLENITSLGNEQFVREHGRINKRKTFQKLSPMHEDEAVEQMELLGHDFFAFLNADTNQFGVLYRRQGEEGGYGLIELDTQSV